MIPTTDLASAYRAHKGAIDGAVKRVLDSGWYLLGKELTAFEEAFSAWVGTSHGIGVGSGTDAIELALRTCGVGRGDLVFTVSHTAVATVAAIERCGAAPVLIDIDPRTFNLDPNLLEESIHRLRQAPGSPGTIEGTPRAIVPVHLYGHPADMPTIMDIARRHGLVVIEDCAQAHGARTHGRRVGTWGDLAAFSFYPTKNLGALGDGGMVLTADGSRAETARSLREYGWKQRAISEHPGINSRLDELQAAVLNARLPMLDAENERRRRIAGVYDDDANLARPDLERPQVQDQCTHVFHQYVIKVQGAGGRHNALRQHLESCNIQTGIHYPVPVHEQPAYRGRIRSLLPLVHTEDTARRILSLPIHPQLTDAQAKEVAEAVGSWSSPKALAA